MYSGTLAVTLLVAFCLLLGNPVTGYEVSQNSEQHSQFDFVLSKDNFYSTVESNALSVVYFSAPVFGAPRLNIDWAELKEALKPMDVSLCVVDARKEGELLSELMVSSAPTLRLYWPNLNSRKYVGPPTVQGVVEYVEEFYGDSIFLIQKDDDRKAFMAQLVPRAVGYFKEECGLACQAFIKMAQEMVGHDVVFAITHDKSIASTLRMHMEPPSLRLYLPNRAPLPFRKKFVKEHMMEFVRSNLDGRLVELEPESIPFGLGYESPLVLTFLNSQAKRAQDQVLILSNMADYFDSALDMEFAYTESPQMVSHFRLQSRDMPLVAVIKNGRLVHGPLHLSRGLVLHKLVEWVEAYIEGEIRLLTGSAPSTLEGGWRKRVVQSWLEHQERFGKNLVKVGGSFLAGEDGHLLQIMQDNGVDVENRSTQARYRMLWTTYTRPDLFTFMKRGQKVNHVPNIWQLGRKDSLYKYYKKALARFGSDIYDYHTETFVLPADYELFKKAYENEPDEIFLVKPSALSRGRGVKVVTDLEDVPKEGENMVQRYIRRPYLFNGKKGTERVYVLITSVDPLRVYVHNNGFVRICSEPYNEDKEGLANPYVHITNIDINQHNENFEHGTVDTDMNNFRWSLQGLFSHLKDDGKDVDKLWRDILDIVRKTIVSTEHMLTWGKNHQAPVRDTMYEILGFDFLIDQDLKPWIIEVNVVPSLKKLSDDQMDARVKGTMLRDMFHLLGVTRNDTIRTDNPVTIPSILEKMGAVDGRCPEGFIPASRVVTDGVLQTPCLTDEEVALLRDTEDEAGHTKGFVRILPFEQPEKYQNLYLDGISTNEQVLAKWITLGGTK